MPRITSTKNWGNAAPITFREPPDLEGKTHEEVLEIMNPIYEKDSDALLGLFLAIVPCGTSELFHKKWSEYKERHNL